jgi:hypothetical protein
VNTAVVVVFFVVLAIVDTLVLYSVFDYIHRPLPLWVALVISLPVTGALQWLTAKLIGENRR